jgi:hypothetical protein
MRPGGTRLRGRKRRDADAMKIVSRVPEAGIRTVIAHPDDIESETFALQSATLSDGTGDISLYNCSVAMLLSSVRISFSAIGAHDAIDGCKSNPAVALSPNCANVMQLSQTIRKPLDPLRLLWVHRFLICQLVERELVFKFKRSRGGMLWLVLQPLLSLAGYTLASRKWSFHSRCWKSWVIRSAGAMTGAVRSMRRPN